MLSLSNTGIARVIEGDSVTAKEYRLENIIVTSNRFKTSVTESPTKIEVIDINQIKNSNGFRLPEILKNSNSVFIKSYGLTPQLQSISINGLGAEHTLVLLDGVRLNFYQNSMFDLSLLPKENIERIEIISSGASAIYGSEAMSSIINIISKNGFKGSDHLLLRYDALISKGSFNTNKYSLGLKSMGKNLFLNLFFNKEDSDGDFNYIFRNGDESISKKREISSYKIYDVGLQVHYIIDKKQLVKFFSSYNNHNKQIPGIETGNKPSISNQLDKNWSNNIVYENFLSENISWKSNLNFQNNLLHYEVKPILNSFYKNLVYNSGNEISIKNGIANLITGYNFVHAVLESNDTENGVKRNQHSIYLLSETELFQGFKLFPSLRSDFISDLDKNIITYKVGINYRPLKDVQLNLRANAGKNFRAPTFNDLYWKESGNKSLKPEYSNNYETGIVYSFHNYFNGMIDVNYTYIEAKDKIVWQPQRTLIWKPNNVAKSLSRSVNISGSLSKNLSSELIVTSGVGVSFTNSRKTSSLYPGDPTYDKLFPYIPLQSYKGNLSIQHSIISFNLFYTYSGERFSDYENKNKLEHYRIWDANISVTSKYFGQFVTLRFEVNNIFNSDYFVISGYPMPLRNFTITFSLNN
jgi:iron complex outermembrane receptor protein